MQNVTSPDNRQKSQKPIEQSSAVANLPTQVMGQSNQLPQVAADVNGVSVMSLSDDKISSKKREKVNNNGEKVTPVNIDTFSPKNIPVISVVEDGENTQPLVDDWLKLFLRHSQLLMAVIEPNEFTLKYANNYFCRMTGIAPGQDGTGKLNDLATAGIRLLDLFPDLKDSELGALYRQQILHLVLGDFYHVDLPALRLLNEPVIVSINSHLYPDPRIIELCLRADELKVSRIDQSINEFADLHSQKDTIENLAKKILSSHQMIALSDRLRWENYKIEGLLLLEGLDVTDRENIRHITRLLIDRDSILRPEKFRQINQKLKNLFRASNSMILSVEDQQARLFIGNDRKELRAKIYSIASLQGSHFLRAADLNRVTNIPDLSKDCQTDCERSLLNQGIRSLLLIPLVVKGIKNHPKQQLAGVVGITSDRPYNFDSLDCKQAEELIPAFAAALRQAIQQRFTNIHPAVEWRFLQEAERRSWGMPPEAIVFNNVYPLYGISDIRGSSEERNRSIQADLLEQFRLALNIVDAVCKFQNTSLGEQLRLDLLDYIETLKGQITVDAEVTALKYLSERIDIYFDYFSQCGSEAMAAVNAYRNSCANDHKSVYVSRALYDQMISQINTKLKETWESWQVRMQQIIPHYCDIECTDGINHMIYVGESIDPKFSPFHLRSLRYEQLKAVCDCARTAFSLHKEYHTQMEVTHLVLVQDLTVDIFHDDNTEKLFEVRGTRDIRYEIVKKRIDKATDEKTGTRITQPGMLTLVYSTEEEWQEYQEYLRYLARENWVDTDIISGTVEPLQGITGLKFARVNILPTPVEEK